MSKLGARVGSMVWPAIVGALAMTAVGFSGFGWTLGGTAEKMANDRAEAAIKVVAVNVLAPICAAQARADPASATKFIEMSALAGHSRASKVMETDWVKIAGVELSSSNRRVLAEECGKLLFEKAS